jgi:WD40 repeat protein
MVADISGSLNEDTKYAEKISVVNGFIPVGWYPTALAVSPGGGRLATGGADGAILLWDVVDGVPAFAGTLSGHVSRVLALAFSADESVLWSAGLERTVQKWNLVRRRAQWGRPHDLGRVLTTERR